jgi:hypothetical protein
MSQDNPNDSNVSSTEIISERVSEQGTSYLVRAELLNPEEEPELERVGYRSPTVLFVILNAGEPIAHHDRHAIERQLPGSNDWILPELRRIAVELLEQHNDSEGA